MTKSIFRYFCLILLISILVCSGISFLVLSSQMLDNTKKDMLYSVKLVDYHLDYNENLGIQVENLNSLAYSNNTRLTIIDNQGNVLADSDKNITENHIDRKEIQEAFKNGVGYAIRYSDTVNKNMLYVAYYNNNHITRLSIPYNGVFNNVSSLLIPFMISIPISLIIALLLARRLTHHLSKPIVEISNEVQKLNNRDQLKFNNYKYDEFNIVTKAIMQQSSILQNTLNNLELEKIKISDILDQMNEGFVLLDEDLKILIANQKVKNLFRKDMLVNSSIKDYIFDIKLIDELDNLSINQQAQDIKINKEIYVCYISQVKFGVILLFVDVTAQRNAMKMRQEFFSNVSHELKTPITSIRGYSELLQAGLIKDEDKKQIALDKIQTEVNNMSSLIDEILMISRLENKDIEVELYPVKIKPIVEEIIQSTQIIAQKKNIKINVECEEIDYYANHQHIHQILNNLISNAIKYNVVDGKIEIEIFKQNNDIIIKVKDTGVGISLADQNRVFERFYRCDKGRDKNSGGSGLGLSIVKHIVQFYKGNIILQSRLKKGTTITISLPMKKQ